MTSIKGTFDDELLKTLEMKNVFGRRVLVESNGKDMEKIADWLGHGILKSHVSQVFDFDDLPKAHLQIETGKTRGKLIVNIE